MGGSCYNPLGTDAGPTPFGAGVSAGAFSYVDGIYHSARHGLALSGAFGGDAQLAAQADGANVTAALNWASQNPGAVGRALCDACSQITAADQQRLGAQIGSRLAIAGSVSTLNPFVGVPAAGAAVYGNMLSAARSGASRINILRAGGVGSF